MRRLWVDEDLQVGAILYNPKSDPNGEHAWVRVVNISTTPVPLTETSPKTTYSLRLLTHARSIQYATLAKMRESGLMLWEPPPADLSDPAVLEKWLALDQPSPPTDEPGTP